MPEVYRPQGKVYVLIPCDYPPSPFERRFLQFPPDLLPS